MEYFKRRNTGTREQRAASRKLHDHMVSSARNLTPRDAYDLAKFLLTEIADDGPDYGEFQAAVAVERAVKHAVRNLP